MPDDVARPVVGAVQLCAQDGPQVSDSDLHRIGDSALCLSRHIDGGPGEHQRRGRIDAARGEESACARHPRARRRLRVGKQQGIADGSEECRATDEDGALAQTFAQSSDGESGDEAEGVRRDGKELGDCGRVAEVLDDTRLGVLARLWQDFQAIGHLPRTGKRCRAAGSWYGTRLRTASTWGP